MAGRDLKMGTGLRHLLMISAIFCSALADAAPFAQHGTSDESNAGDIVVVGKRDGPVRWKLTRGKATIWVVPRMNFTPASLTWRTRTFERLLRQAKTLVIADDFSQPIDRNMTIRPARGARELLSADLLPTFEKVAAAARVSADSFRAATAAGIVWKLGDAVLENRGLRKGDSSPSIGMLAIRSGIRLDYVRAMNGQAIREAHDTLAYADQSCLALAFRDMATISANGHAKAEAWANNDKERYVALFQPLRQIRCQIERSPRFAEQDERDIMATVAAIEDRLDRKGTTLVLVWEERWLRPNGILDRLRAKGVAIDAPPDRPLVHG